MEQENQPAKSEEIIKLKMKKMGYSYDELDDKEKGYLNTIESNIQYIYDREKIAKELLTKNNISIKNISQQSQIARQTFYNIPILSEYVNYNSNEFKKVDISEELNGYRDEIKRLNKDLENKMKRDIEIEELKIKNKYYVEQIRLKDKQIASIMARNSHKECS